MKSVASIISHLFHPLFMPTIGLLIVFNTNSYINYTTPSELKYAALLLVVLSSCIIPMLVAMILLNKKIISSLEMPTSKERLIPYLTTILAYFFILYMFQRANLPPIIFNFISAAALSLILAFIINLKWKISAHMIGIGGLAGLLVSLGLLLNTDILLYVTGALTIAGFIGTSRLILKAHTSAQVYAGFMLGFICQFYAIYHF